MPTLASTLLLLLSLRPSLAISAPGALHITEVTGYDNATAYAPGAPFSCSFAAPATAALPLNISLRAYFNATGYAVDPGSIGGVVAASWLVWELNGALQVPSLPPNITIGY